MPQTPKSEHQRNQKKNALPSHDVLNKARSFLLTNSLFASRTSCSIKSCLLCCNVQMCTHASQVRIRFELHPPTFRVCVSTVKIRDVDGVPCVPECHLLQLPCCKKHGARLPPTTGSRVLALPHEQKEKTSQAAFQATLQQQSLTLYRRGSAAMLSVRCGERDAMECVCFGTDMA